MKRIVIAALLAGSTLMAADTPKSLDGEALYQKHCATCHGKKGEKSPDNKVAPLAGRDATVLALTIRAYRDQDKNIGTFTMHKENELMKFETWKFSDVQISAIAKYISSLK